MLKQGKFIDWRIFNSPLNWKNCIRVRPFIITYMGTTLSWKSSVSWLREISSFWNWTTGSRASSRMNINSLGMNHLISQEWNAIEIQKFHRFVAFDETHYCGRFHVEGWSPQGDTIMFIFGIFPYFGRKQTWIHLFVVGLKHSKFRAIDRLLVIFDFGETPDVVTSTIPEI